MATKQLHIHQIWYDELTHAHVDPAFIPLENVDNERPDWREYWPMRQYLSSHQLDEDALYGFFSPKFHLKTGLTGQDVREFVDSHEADVYIFSPYVEQSTLFLNVFEQAETQHPGFRNALQQFSEAAGLPSSLYLAVGDFSNSVYSNFFLAKPLFWRQWLRFGEALFVIAESGDGELAQALNGAAKYHENVGEVALKVFLMERLVTMVLLIYKFTTAAYDPFKMERTGIPISFLDQEMRICNALKMAYMKTGDAGYIDTFLKFRSEVLSSV